MLLIRRLSCCARAYTITRLDPAVPLCYEDSLKNTKEQNYLEHNLTLRQEHNRVYIVLVNPRVSIRIPATWRHETCSQSWRQSWTKHVIIPMLTEQIAFIPWRWSLTTLHFGFVSNRNRIVHDTYTRRILITICQSTDQRKNRHNYYLAVFPVIPQRAQDDFD